MSNEQDVVLTVLEQEPTQDIILTAVEPEPTQLITTNEGVVHLPDATRTRKGVVKVGSGLNIESGNISLDESYIKVNEIHLNGNKVEPDEQKRVFLEVDKTTVGLGNVDNTSDLNKPVSTATQTELNKKLDKQQSPALADKYLHVDANGNIDFVSGVGGLIDVVKRNGVELEIVDKTVDIDVPVKTSELVNDGSDGAHPFITAEDIPETISKHVITTSGDSGLLSESDYNILVNDTKNAVIRNGSEEYELVAVETDHRTYIAKNTSSATNVTFYAITVNTSEESDTFRSWSKANIDPFTKVEASDTNGHISVNGSDVKVYELPGNVLDTGDITNNVTSTATDKALSANMGYELKQQIDNIATIGRYLSQWNCITGLPVTNPPTLPYEYHKGDYYRVSEVGITRATKYKPSGTQYTGVASTEVETDTDIKPDDIYFYDGAVWILQKVIVRDVSFGGIIGNPHDNTALSDALDAKQDSINDLSTIRDNASAGKTASDTIATYGNVVTHNANEFVDTTTNQSIGGTKTFTSRPKVNSTDVALVDDIPTTLPNPNNITFVKNGMTVATYDGSSARTVDLTQSVSGVTDVKINNTSIVSGTTATFNTKTAYNASTNKIVTETDLSDLVDKTSTQNISGTKNFDNLKFDGYEIKKTATDGVAITGSGVNMLLVEPGLGKEELNSRQVLFEDKVGVMAYKDKVDYSTDVFNKPTIPIKTSQLTNDSDFATETDITTALATAKAQWLLDMNPIGTIIENNTGTNPSTYIGGTWKLYGQGKVTVCFDSSDNDFGGIVGTTGSYQASTQIADYGTATINLTAGKGKIDHIVYNGTTINNGASTTFINNFYFSVFDKYVLIDSDYDSSQTCTITIYHIPAEGKMSGGSKALQQHTHTATFSGTTETGWFQPLTGGQGKTYATDGKMFTKGSNYSASGVYDRAAGNAVRANLTITPKGTITVDSAGTGDQANLQPYIVVYRWIRTA